MVTTLFQYCNAVLRIVPCNITFRQPILLMVKPVLFCTVKETNTDHPISDSQMESQFRRSIALRSNLSKSVFFVFFLRECPFGSGMRRCCYRPLQLTAYFSRTVVKCHVRKRRNLVKKWLIARILS